MNTKEIQEIIGLLKKSDITELELQQGDQKLRIVRGSVRSGAALVSSVLPVAGEVETGVSREPKPENKAEEKLPGHLVTSPFVGTFYRASSPTAAPFVEVGTTIGKGQTICIIEAMKLMNEIESDYNGKVTKIFVENGQPVEFGEKLFLIEEA